jgi:homoaconitase/3-isopropylmalate dehydratase large subunit
MKLIENWRHAWRFLSVQAMTLAIALQGVWLNLPDDLRVHVPDRLAATVTAALLVLGLIGRLFQQRGADGTTLR